jgi:hypothetical protein
MAAVQAARALVTSARALVTSARALATTSAAALASSSALRRASASSSLRSAVFVALGLVFVALGFFRTLFQRIEPLKMDIFIRVGMAIEKCFAHSAWFLIAVSVADIVITSWLVVNRPTFTGTYKCLLISLNHKSHCHNHTHVLELIPSCLSTPTTTINNEPFA